MKRWSLCFKLFLLVVSSFLSVNSLKCYHCLFMPEGLAFDDMDESCKKGSTPNKKAELECGKVGKQCVFAYFTYKLSPQSEIFEGTIRACVNATKNQQDCKSWNKNDLKNFPHSLKCLNNKYFGNLSPTQLKLKTCTCSGDLCNNGDNKYFDGSASASTGSDKSDSDNAGSDSSLLQKSSLILGLVLIIGYLALLISPLLI